MRRGPDRWHRPPVGVDIIGQYFSFIHIGAALLEASALLSLDCALLNASASEDWRRVLSAQCDQMLIKSLAQ